MANRRPLVIIDGLKQGIGPGDNLDIATGQTYNVGGVPHTHRTLRNPSQSTGQTAK